VLGRRIEMVTCDDGDGEVQRSKTCLKKLVDQDRIFALITGADWATASIHDDLHQYRLPYVGVWAYSQTEWQDPFMFPTHMSMVHEAMAGARWVRDVIRPRTYGLLCLNSPEMQLACSNVARILGLRLAAGPQDRREPLGDLDVLLHPLLPGGRAGAHRPLRDEPGDHGQVHG
jgi:hypothetical protein